MTVSPNKLPGIKRRFTWNMHYDCNYRCPYCFFEGKWQEYKKRNIYFSTQEMMKYWSRIYELYGCCYMLITGGEPFTYPDFINLISRLSEIHNPINISTNASGNLELFVKRVDSRRVSLSVSFQPHFEKLDNFLAKVKLLRNNKFDGCINFVAYPEFLDDIKDYSAKFKAIGEELKIIPFWGIYEGREYPFSYSDAQKEIVGVDASWFKKVRKKHSLCPAGFSSALIFPDGKVARCGQIGERVIIGNFFDSGFKLLDKQFACEAEYCPCDENKIFGEDESDANQ